MLDERIGDLPVVTNNHKVFAKFHFGTLGNMDTIKETNVAF